MPFSITPLTEMPAPDQSDFPNFLQWRQDGVDLGLPDADTIDCTAGITATRGTGENSNVITLSAADVTGVLQVQEDGVNLGAPNVDTLNFAAGILALRGSDNTVTVTVDTPEVPGLQVQEDGVDLGAADVTTLNFADGIGATRGSDGTVTITVDAAPPPPPAPIAAGVMTLESNPDPSGPIAFFDATPFTHLDWSASTVVVASDDWDIFENLLHFINAGIYRITFTSFVQAENEWPSGNTTYGAYFDDVISAQARTHTGGDTNDAATRMTWTDQLIVNATADTSYFVGVYGLATNHTAGILFAGMTLVIEKLADA